MKKARTVEILHVGHCGHGYQLYAMLGATRTVAWHTGPSTTARPVGGRLADGRALSPCVTLVRR